MIIESGQAAVVTGAASGIGKAVAAELAGRGVSVVLADLREDTLQATADELTAASGGTVLAVPTDVRDPEAVQALAARTMERFGRLDLAVNNAGIGPASAPVWEVDLDDWRNVLDVNLNGVLHGIRAFVPHMIAAGRGHVVNIASLSGLSTHPYGAAYCASKHGVVAISETLRTELDLTGNPIGVTVVCPALVHTPLVTEVFDAIDAAEGMDLEPTQRALVEGLRASVSDMIEPEVAAQRILEAVHADRLHLLTNGDLAGTALQRTQRVLDAITA